MLHLFHYSLKSKLEMAVKKISNKIVDHHWKFMIEEYAGSSK